MFETRALPARILPVVLCLALHASLATGEPSTVGGSPGGPARAIRSAAAQVDAVLSAAEPQGALSRCAREGRDCETVREGLLERYHALVDLHPALVAALEQRAGIAAAAGRADDLQPTSERILTDFDAFIDRLAHLADSGIIWPPDVAAVAELAAAARQTLHTERPAPSPPGPPAFRPPEYASAPKATREELPEADAGAGGGKGPGLADIPPEYLTQTPEVRFTAELDETIAIYHGDPLLVMSFVRDEIRFQPYYGAMKHSQDVMDTHGGNALDQASLLVAALRRMGIPARYARGTVEVPIARARAWLGVEDSQTVGDILATGGIPVTLITDGLGTIVAVRFEHVWVEAYLAFSNYRGILNRSGGEAWIPLDPSFQELQGNGGSDLATDSGLDADVFLDQMLATVTPRSPAEQYLLDLQSFVEAQTPGANFYSALWGTDLLPDLLATAPASLPYTTIAVLERFAEVPDALRHKVRFLANGLDHTEALVDLVGNRVTLGYEPATQADRDVIAGYGNIYDTPPNLINVRPEIRIAGALAASGGAIGFGRNDTFTMEFFIGAGPHEAVSNVLNAGGRYAIGVAAQDITSQVVYRRTALFDAGVDSVGLPGFDDDDTLGESLFLHAMAYWQEVCQLQELTARSMQLVQFRDVSEAIVGTALVVIFSGGTPVDVDPGGIYIDVDRSITAAFSIDGDHAQRRDFQIIGGSTGSALEHIIFEEIWSNTSVSTIKIIQAANDLLVPVFDIDGTNRGTLVPQLTHPQSVIDAVNDALNRGLTVTIPRDPIAINAWTGTGWIEMDMVEGTAGYLISGGLSGGSFTEYQQYVEDLVRSGEITREQGDELIRQARERIHLPVSDPVNSQYGERTDPITGQTRFHEGVDFQSPVGTDVHSSAAGEVARSYTSSTYGETVIVNHGTDANGNTVYSLYAHNSTRLVNQGDAVTAGQQIADSGNTGRSTGPHVHHEVRVIPPGGPDPFQSQFFDAQYTVDPTDYMWPDLTPP